MSINKISYRIILMISLFTYCLNIESQNISQIKKEHKDFIKSLKNNGFNSVKVEVGDNGFWYFKVNKKVDGTNLYGAYDCNENVLFECKYSAILYLSEIKEDGYREFTFGTMTGEYESASLYCYAMPGHFLLDGIGGVDKYIALTDGTVISEFKVPSVFALGSWLFTNHKKMYTRELGGYRKLIIANNESKDMGMRKWDGTKLLDNNYFLMTITLKKNNTYNANLVFDTNACVGAFFLEDLNLIVPTEYSEIQANYNTKTFDVKLSPIDRMHPFDPNVKERYIPKNDGERFIRQYKYNEAIEYYANAGVDDPDSKFFSANAMASIGVNHSMVLLNHLQNPYGNSLKGYDYNEAKTLLVNSIEVLKTAVIQDTARADIYEENMKTYKRYLNQLENNNSLLKQNSFGNQLLNAVLAGLADGIKNAAVQSVQNIVSPTRNNSAAHSYLSASSNQNNHSNPNSNHSNSNNNSDKSTPVQYRECHKCRGTGEIFTTSTIPTYGNDKKVRCDHCGQEHWASTVHHHRKCDNCKGTGKVPK